MNVFSFSFYFLILWCTFSFFLAVFLTCPLVNYRRLFQFEGRCSLGVSGENATRRDYKVRVASRIVTQFNLRISRTANWLVIDSSPARIMNIQRSTFNVQRSTFVIFYQSHIPYLSSLSARRDLKPGPRMSTRLKTKRDQTLYSSAGPQKKKQKVEAPSTSQKQSQPPPQKPDNPQKTPNAPLHPNGDVQSNQHYHVSNFDF